MAVLDQDLEYSINKALEIINNLPEEDRKYVEIYINNIKTVLDRTREENKRMCSIFKQIAYYGK